MSIDYGRLTAKDRRGMQRGVMRLRHNAIVVSLPMGQMKWCNVKQCGWQRWAWDESLYFSDKGARILESLLMTDRRFR